MVKRRSYRFAFYLAFSLIVLLSCWESNRTSAAVLTPEIPKDSIRLRILANSDTVQDQTVKRRVRDAVVAEMDTWVNGPTTIEQAREIVREHIPELENIVGSVLKANGFDYGYKVELGIVPFPTKMYGNRVYPAGDYEALRITLGSGEGQNWWCVLFPPLCFVDAATGEAAAKSAEPATDAKTAAAGDKAASEGAVKKQAGSDAAVKKADASESKSTDGSAKSGERSAKPEVRFFFWDLLKQLINWIRGLFA